MLTDHPKKYQEITELMGQLGGKIPNTMEAFERLHISSTEDGTLSRKIKELIALGIAITVRCDGCIAFHVHDALDSGATSEEISETIGVAVLMGGGPSVVYGCEALEALEQFSVLAD
ncbi:carboxymuconolactone decarboxylase family protein [Flagellimonas iocasae]|uniref:Carboxymuconolactone decarboxylase family protein n=1 Tax=Flagellimonas iocasae TaxID=2055905 RepID=A0ABW4XUB1_9FLAO